MRTSTGSQRSHLERIHGELFSPSQSKFESSGTWTAFKMTAIDVVQSRLDSGIKKWIVNTLLLFESEEQKHCKFKEVHKSYANSTKQVQSPETGTSPSV